MKRMLIIFSEKEYKQLKDKKGEKTWKAFVLDLAGVNEDE